MGNSLPMRSNPHFLGVGAYVRFGSKADIRLTGHEADFAVKVMSAFSQKRTLARINRRWSVRYPINTFAIDFFVKNGHYSTELFEEVTCRVCLPRTSASPFFGQ